MMAAGYKSLRNIEKELQYLTKVLLDVYGAEGNASIMASQGLL